MTSLAFVQTGATLNDETDSDLGDSDFEDEVDSDDSESSRDP